MGPDEIVLEFVVYYLNLGRGVSVDVWPVRRSVRGHELRVDADQMGPLDVRGRRQS